MKMSKFSDYSTDDLIKWRNEASSRVSMRESTTEKFLETIDMMDKKNHSDKKWILKLNREVHKRSFGYKTKINDEHLKRTY
jgi:hypothetical protein